MYPCENCDRILEEEFDFGRQYKGVPYHTEMDTHLCEYCCQQHDKAEEIDFDNYHFLRELGEIMKEQKEQNDEENELDFINTMFQEILNPKQNKKKLTEK